MKYLPLYKKWIKTGKLPWRGLCGSLPDDDNLYLFDGLGGFWGYNGEAIFGSDVWHNHNLYLKVTQEFTPLRQNIVLFMAAMNNEL